MNDYERIRQLNRDTWIGGKPVGLNAILLIIAIAYGISCVTYLI